MSFKLNLYTFAVFEVIYYDLASLLGTNTDSMSIGTERNRRQWRLYVYFLNLFALNDVVEKDTSIKAR